MSVVRVRLLATLLGVVPLIGLVLVAAPTADASRAWAPEATATIKPGVQMYTGDAQCTGNFVFKDKAGHVYVGYAAHCAGTGSDSQTNGCKTSSRKIGTEVDFVTGGNFFSAGTTVGKGKLAYSSWVTMHQRRTTNVNRCAYNDFALVRVDPGSVGKVNPTVPTFGGPTGVAPLLAVGAPIYTIGSSSLRGTTAAKTGTVLAVDGGGFAYDVRTGNPGVPGDSGSGFLDSKGRVTGVLSTLNVGIALMPVTNTMGNLTAELDWAQKYSGIKGLVLVHGTRGFKP
ncbi:MAG: hypothetical protein JWP74_1031 [Marmoricola sp.]|nr:hypothetical protein [Marmoricola sp.]